ncbi:MAG: LysM domain-containing protein [Caldilineaceae bacterium]
MSNIVASAMNWFAGAFYVIVALAIVYLYFFRLVPLVLASVKAWTFFDVIRITFVLGGLAFLLGVVAVFTADWIFSQVFDNLPQTRMARELSRISGSTLKLTARMGSSSSGGGMMGSSAETGTEEEGGTPAPTAAPTPAYLLKENALGIWAAELQKIYNPTGSTSDNSKVMAKRDIPEGVACDVFSDSSGWWPKKYESWQLLCSNNDFKTTVPIQANGTAARGLTGGSFYSRDNPFTVYGTGRWPDAAYDTSKPVPTATPQPAGGPTNPSSGTPAATGAAGKHIVKMGDSLGSIANKYGVTVGALIKANVDKHPILRQNPNMLVVGWELIIPAK